MTLDGVLFFPVTPFAPDGGLAPGALADHIRQGVEHRPGGVFAACGTGEFTALSETEHAEVVRVAVATTAGAVPVFAGAGGPFGAALAQARAAREAGADGLLLMPPYLAQGPDFAGYVRAIAAVLPTIVYQRGPIALEPETVVELAAIPGVLGLKDGLGDIDRMQRIVLAVRAERRDFLFFNGLPTAELTQPAYRAIGVDLYSSAVFCFAPEIANAYLGGDERLIAEFYAPLVRLRSKVPGYAVALVKAGVRLRGLDAGPVRPPLVPVSAEHEAELEALIKSGLALVAS